MIISIISKTEISSLEISELQNYYGNNTDVALVSNCHIVIRSKGVYDITPDTLYTSLSVESLTGFMREQHYQEEVA